MFRKLFAIVWIGVSSVAFAQTDTEAKTKFTLRLEQSQFWTNRNDTRIPGDTGTLFSLNDLTGRRAISGNTRFDLTYRQFEDTEWRLLYAPLGVSGTGNLSQPTVFRNTTFAAGPAFGFYQFNSYRVTYRRKWKKSEKSDWMFGYTLKIRDAEVRLEQGGNIETERDPSGIVPLLHLSGIERLNDKFFFDFDIDGLFAPQGRAIDAGARFNYQVNDRGDSVFLGVRALEGGADNPRVYSFAAIYYVSLGYTIKF